jgi:predicted methyltransferase
MTKKVGSRASAFALVALLFATACARRPEAPAESPDLAPPASAALVPVTVTTTPPASPSAASAAPSASPPPTPAPIPVAVPPEIQAVIDASDRSADDRALDTGRHPGELLAFAGIKAGMKVAEIGAGGGYTSELLARTVGAKGKVFGVNVSFVLKRFAEQPWSERLKKPVMKKVVRIDREYAEPLPPEAKNLDVVLSVLVYHDIFWQGGDRDKMNAAIFRALRSGGAYVIIDHSGRPGTGSTEVETLHRIEESVIKDEIARAGFRLAEEGTFLRNPSDTRDWSASPRTAGERRGTSDRFALKFVKP